MPPHSVSSVDPIAIRHFLSSVQTPKSNRKTVVSKYICNTFPFLTVGGWTEDKTSVIT